MPEFIYIGVEEALALHATVLGMTTGRSGVRDMSGLLASLARPQTTIGGQDMFATAFDKAAALIESTARHHAFIDGNKRTAHLLGARFLAMNGYGLSPERGEIETLMLWIVNEKPQIEDIAAWLEARSKKL